MSFLFYELVGKDAARPFSPHCWKVRMALAHKGVVFDTIPVRFTQIREIENGGYTTVPLIKHGSDIYVDSFDISLYLKLRYPDLGRYLFKGDGSVGISRFVESWANTTLHPWISAYALMDIYNLLDEQDQDYFRQTREKRFGKPLEEVVKGREERVADFVDNRLAPLRNMLGRQKFIGGNDPLFADYIVFGAIQWLRVTSGLHMIAADDPIRDWIKRCLELHGGVGASVSEAGG